MNDMIKQIVDKNKKDLEKKKQEKQLEVLQQGIKDRTDERDFYKSIKEGNTSEYISLIAEIKFASPTEKELGDPNDMLTQAASYEKAGANAISLITEPYFFKGDSGSIAQVKKTVSLPILQKDFIVDPYQIYEAVLCGADALLLIVKLLDEKALQEFVTFCFSLGIEPVVEINDETDLEKAITTKTRIIAVNARDLDTFHVDIQKAYTLMQQIPEPFVKLGFSGIHTNEDMRGYKKAGASGVLVGTSLMKAKDIENTIKDITYVG